MPRLRAPSLTDLRTEIAAQGAHWRPWCAVSFGLGAALYMTLMAEPPLWLLAPLAGMAGGVALVARLRNRHRGQIAILALVFFFTAGVLAAKLRTLGVAAPIAPAEQAPHRIDAYVVDVASPGASGPRLILAPVRISGITPAKTPIRLRITLPDDTIPAPGSAISLTGVVGPSPRPASPGSHDFARDAYFDGIGGVGFIRGAIRPISLPPPPARLRWTMALNAARWRLANRIVAILGPRAGGMAVAMVTGHEAWITNDQTEQMRDSGLAHILSISGLHMAIVGGFVFALMRLLIAAIPPLALRVNGKKLAAGVALACVGGYLLLSGAPPAAERAAITAAVAFGAIMIDRRALSLHALSVAALIILLFQPEAAVQAGFQMSFAATAALVALAGLVRRPVREISVPLPIRLAQGAAFWFFGGLLVSLVAGMATAPFAMHHFNRVSTYGLPANLAVEPLSSFVIMPFLALGAVLTPLGWGAPFLKVAGWGLEAMQAIAHWFAGLPMANVTVATGPPVELLVAFLGVMLACLWQGRLRWLGLPLACAVLVWPRPPTPDLWIADDGAQVGMRVGKQAVVLRPATQAFAADLWSRRRGLTLVDDEAVRSKSFDCNRNRCLPLAAAPVKVAARFRLTDIKPEEWDELCKGAEVIVLRTERTAPCAGAVVLSGSDFAAGGAAELYRRADGWAITWAQPQRGRRPWTG